MHIFYRSSGLINTGYGLVAGAATAFIFFRSNTWRASVTTFGAGAGLGYSVSEIKNMFEAVKPAAAKSAAPSTPAH